MHYNTEEVMIPATSFQEFDQRIPVEVSQPDNITLKVGDTIWWSAAQYDGICEVVGVDEQAASRGKVYVKKD